MSNNPMALPSDPQAISKVGGGISALVKGVGDMLGRVKQSRMDHFEEGHGNASGGGLTVEHINAIGGLMGAHRADELISQQSKQGHELEVLKAQGNQARANMRAVSKIAGETKAGTRKTVQATPEGGMSIVHTTAPAPKNSANAPKTTGRKPAVKAAAPVPTPSQAAKRPRGAK